MVFCSFPFFSAWYCVCFKFYRDVALGIIKGLNASRFHLDHIIFLMTVTDNKTKKPLFQMIAIGRISDRGPGGAAR